MALPQMQIGDGLIGNALLSSVEVVQELNQHWWCTVVCRNTEDARVPVEDLLGQPVQVKTTDDDGVEHIHFSGTVHDVELEYEVWGSYTATLVAVSDTYRADVTAHKQYYPEQTLSAIAATIGGRQGLPVAVSAPDGKALDYVQYGESDWSFLNRIVDDAGAWMRPSASNGIEIFNSFQAGAAVQWRGENNLISFRLRGRRVNPSFSGSHYDPHAMQSGTFKSVSKAPVFYPSAQALTSSVQAASAQLPAGFEPQRSRAMTLDNYNDQLQAESERSLGSAVTGSGASRNQSLKAGDTVNVQGTLDAQGTYGLTRVAHHWSTQGYSNDFTCTPWMQYRDPNPPAARVWNGIVPARVTAHNDPKKMGRIQVQYFWQEDNSTHWARTTSPHAGPDRGFMFMPEVGDEVAVAFEDGDPERPVIIGSLWNGVHTAPRLTLRGDDIDDNDVKRLITKSGNRLQFSDKEGVETVVLATPNNNRIRMTEQADRSGRTNITIESNTGDIVLHAPNGRVHIESLYYSKDIGQQAAATVAAAAKGGAAKPPAAPTRAQQVAAWRKSHRAAIRRALANQRALLLKRKAQLTAWDDNTKAQARTWFGSDTPATRQALLDRTDRELALNNKMTINNFQPPEPGKANPNNFAYVYPNDPTHTVYLDQQFENAPAVGQDSQAGTLAHEMSHFNDVAGTVDTNGQGVTTYGVPASRALATTDPAAALNHADSYEYFVEGIK